MSQKIGAQLRFGLGSFLGIMGLGQMGQTLIPFRGIPFLQGIGFLVIGLFLSLGVIVALRRGKNSSNKSTEIC